MSVLEAVEKKLLEGDTDETISEICRQFLDKRIPDDGVDGRGADHFKCKSEEEKRQFHDQFCTNDDEYSEFGFGNANGWDDGSCSHGARPAGRNYDYHGSEDDGRPGQTHNPGTTDLEPKDL